MAYQPFVVPTFGNDGFSPFCVAGPAPEIHDRMCSYYGVPIRIQGYLYNPNNSLGSKNRWAPEKVQPYLLPAGPGGAQHPTQINLAAVREIGRKQFMAALLPLANAESYAGTKARQAQKNAENSAWPPASRSAAWKQSATEWLSARQAALQIAKLYAERGGHPWIQASSTWDPANAQGTGDGNVRAGVYQQWSQWALSQAGAVLLAPPVQNVSLANVPQQGGYGLQSYPAYGRYGED